MLGACARQALEGDRFFQYLKDAFDVLWEEGATQPKMMSIGLHCRIVGRPGRALGLAKFLDYVKSKEKVCSVLVSFLSNFLVFSSPPPPSCAARIHAHAPDIILHSHASLCRAERTVRQPQRQLWRCCHAHVLFRCHVLPLSLLYISRDLRVAV